MHDEGKKASNFRYIKFWNSKRLKSTIPEGYIAKN